MRTTLTTVAVTRRAAAGVVLTAALTLPLAACAGTETPEAAPPTTAGAAHTPSASPAPAEAVSVDDPCGLLSDEDLSAVFGGTVPEADGGSMGAGFADCEWEGDGRRVLVSVVPAEKLATDYLDQLATAGPAPELGDNAAYFKGFVGIGRASARGAAVGFEAGGAGLLVAATSDAGTEADQATVHTLAQAIHARLA